MIHLEPPNEFRPGQLVEHSDGTKYRIVGAPSTGSIIEATGEPYYVYFKKGEAPIGRTNRLLEKSAFEDGRFSPAAETKQERARETF